MPSEPVAVPEHDPRFIRIRKIYKVNVTHLTGIAMSLPPEIAKRLRLPVICSPLFIISNPDLTIAPVSYTHLTLPTKA